MNNLNKNIEEITNNGKAEVLSKFKSYIEGNKEFTNLISIEYYLIGLTNIEKELTDEYKYLYDNVNTSTDRETLLFFLEKRKRGVEVMINILKNHFNELYISKENVLIFLNKKIFKLKEG